MPIIALNILKKVQKPQYREVFRPAAMTETTDKKKYVTEVVADEVQFLSTRNETESRDDSSDFADLKPVSDDELPF